MFRDYLYVKYELKVLYLMKNRCWSKYNGDN